MKLNKSEIALLDRILNNLNSITSGENIKGQNSIESLYEFINEDNLPQLLSTLSKVKSSNIAKAKKMVYSCKRCKVLDDKSSLYEPVFKPEDVSKSFEDFSNDELVKKFSLIELRAMYFCLFSEKASKSKTKLNIIDAIRNYIYTSKRATAFNI